MSTPGRSMRLSRTGLTDMPAEVLSMFIAAADDDGATAAALHCVCRSLRDTVATTSAALRLRQFGSSQQIAPLLQRFSGVQEIVLEECGSGALPWQELGQLMRLRSLSLPLTNATSELQPLSALQRLTALTFMAPEYGTAAELPTAALTHLIRLIELDASACGKVSCASVTQLSAMQQLRTVRMVCHDVLAVTALAEQLPHLQSLDLHLLHSSPRNTATADAAHQPSLAGATALTELRLTAATAAVDIVRQLSVPPGLKTLLLTVDANCGKTTPNNMVDLLNALPLECLEALSVTGEVVNSHASQQLQLALPPTPPLLTRLSFDNTHSFHSVEAQLWPLVTLAATSSGWRLHFSCSSCKLELTAADVLLPKSHLLTDTDAGAAMRGCMLSVCISSSESAKFLARHRNWHHAWASLMDLAEHEPRLRCLALSSKLELEDVQLNAGGGAGGQMSVSSLTALQCLDVPCLQLIAEADCAVLSSLAALTRLALPAFGTVTMSAIANGMHASARSLRELRIGLPLSPDTMAVLQPLVALTSLQLFVWQREQPPRAARPCNWQDLEGFCLGIRHLEINHRATNDSNLASTLAFMPRLQELHVISGRLGGSCLAALAEQCRLLKVLHLDNLPELSSTHLPLLQHLTDLAVLELRDIPLDMKFMKALGRNMPSNLQKLVLQRRHIYSNQWISRHMPLSDRALAAMIAALPSPPPPLRHLSLLRQLDLPSEDETLSALTKTPNKLACLQRLDLGELVATSEALTQLRRLPALVELTCQNVLHYEELLEERLAKVRKAFTATGRCLHTKLWCR